ncbi:SRPBCC domain-containing protein [Streptomyces cellulosae]
MIVDRSITIAAPASETFRRVLDIPFVGSCLAGARGITEDGPGTYSGLFSVKVGPVKVTIQGQVRVLESDETERTAVLRLSGSDRGIGGSVSGDLRIQVVERAGETCELIVHTDVTISGRLGQFGQAVIVRKTDQITREFVEAFSRKLAEQPLPQAVSVPAGAARPMAPLGASELRPVGPTAAVDRDAEPSPQRGPAVPAAPVFTVEGGGSGPHTLGALLRLGRRWVAVQGSRDAERAARRASGLGALWSPDGTGTAVRGTYRVPWVAEVRASGPEELAARIRALDTAAPGAPAAVAVRPRGAAVADPAAMAGLCRGAGERSGLPVMLVVGTPWTALLAARVAAAGAAQGIAVFADEPGRPATASAVRAAMVAAAVAEIREAGIELPVVAGPAPGRHAVAALLQSGADGVVTGRPDRPGLLSAARRRRARALHG